MMGIFFHPPQKQVFLFLFFHRIWEIKNNWKMSILFQLKVLIVEFRKFPDFFHSSAAVGCWRFVWWFFSVEKHLENVASSVPVGNPQAVAGGSGGPNQHFVGVFSKWNPPGPTTLTPSRRVLGYLRCLQKMSNVTVASWWPILDMIFPLGEPSEQSTYEKEKRGVRIITRPQTVMAGWVRMVN